MAPWLRVKGEVLNQGDLLRDIAVPSVQTSFPDHDENGNIPLNVGQANIIVLSQSCDLEQKKVPSVVVAQTYTIDEFEVVNPAYNTKGRWTEVARGRVEALHLLPPTESPDDPRSWVLVDFRVIFSLPVGYVARFADKA